MEFSFRKILLNESPGVSLFNPDKSLSSFVILSANEYGVKTKLIEVI